MYTLHNAEGGMILNLIHHRADFNLEASWTFTAVCHGKGVDDGIGALAKAIARYATLAKTIARYATPAKTIARYATLAKNILLSTAKDFNESSKAQQLKTERRSNNNSPGVRVFFLEAEEVEKVKNNILKARSEKLRKSGETNIFLNI